MSGTPNPATAAAVDAVDGYGYWGNDGAIHLADLIDALTLCDPTHVAHLGWTRPHSYRGYYDDLGLVATFDTTIGNMLVDLNTALGATYQGWKGGEFTITGTSGVHIVPEIGSCGIPVSAALLRLILDAPGDPAPWNGRTQ